MSQRSSRLTRNLGAAVRRIREERGLTQAELAQAVGLGSVQVSRIERGVQEPRFVTIERLAEALEVDVGALWGLDPKDGKESSSAREKGHVAEKREPYSASDKGPQSRRLRAFVRHIDTLEEDVASAALEASISLARELVKRTGRRQRTDSGRKPD